MKVAESRVEVGSIGRDPLLPSIGLVVDVLTPDPTAWAREIEQIRDACSPGHLELWMEYIPDKRERRNLSAALDGLPVTVHAPFVDMSIATRWEEHAAACVGRLRNALEVSIELGASVFTIHAGKFADYEDHRDALQRVANRYDELVQHASSSIEIGIENLKCKRSGVSRESVATLDDLREVCTINPEIQLTPDVGHAVQNGDDPSSLLFFAAERTASVHLHDAVLGERSHRAFGDGDLPLDSVADAIVALNPKFLTLELLTLSDGVRSYRMLQDRLKVAREKSAVAQPAAA